MRTALRQKRGMSVELTSLSESLLEHRLPSMTVTASHTEGLGEGVEDFCAVVRSTRDRGVL
eukprot:SAG11_NODE_22918_length_398_cov_0.688963_1_plen_60_part_10